MGVSLPRDNVTFSPPLPGGQAVTQAIWIRGTIGKPRKRATPNRDHGGFAPG